MSENDKLDPSTIQEILTDLGYNLDDRGDYWQTNAIYRGGDNKTALQIYKNSGVWKDYVQETGFLPFKALVEKSCEDLSQQDLDKILKGLKETSLNSHSKPKTPIVFEEVYKEDDLEKLLPHYSFYNERGISDKVLEKFKGGLSTRGQMYQRFVFPIYNDYKQIIGFAGRDMINKEGRPKWKHVGKKTKWIYPLYNPNFSNSDWHNQEILLVESIGDLLSIEQNTDRKCLVTFGLDVSPSLINGLVSISPKSIIISLNNDQGNKENRGLNSSIKNYLKLLQFFDAEKLTICLPTKNDFGDMDEKEYNLWESKLKKIKESNQAQEIKTKAKDLYVNKKISKNLYSKTKLINE